MAFFFSVSGYSLLAGEVIDSAIATNGILLLGVAAAFMPYLYCGRRFTARPALSQARVAIAGICLSALATAFFIVIEDETRSDVLRVCFFKTGGLCVMAAAVAYAAPLYRPREVTFALLAFVASELLVISASFVFLHVEFNANTIGSRTSTIGLITVACFSPFIVRAAGFCGSLVISIVLQCRTSAVATGATLMIASIETKSRRARFAVVISVILLGGILGMFADDAQREIKQLAIRHLGSKHFVAQFFLGDKNRAKIDSDLLDRGRVWKASIKQIKRRPVLGFGVGTEMKRFKYRSHNAYLSVAIEGGIIFLIAWILLYVLALTRMLHWGWSEQFADLVAGRAMIYLLSYMLLSAMVESSGLGSISSPVNVVFLFLLFWTSQWFDPNRLSTEATSWS
nr:O-antigen ligase family protein [Rhodopirellula sp. SM50]